jgi:hypothetical protein
MPSGSPQAGPKPETSAISGRRGTGCLNSGRPLPADRLLWERGCRPDLPGTEPRAGGTGRRRACSDGKRRKDTDDHAATRRTEGNASEIVSHADRRLTWHSTELASAPPAGWDDEDAQVPIRRE